MIDSKLTEKAREQEYFDRAAEHRARHQRALAQAATAAAHPAAAVAIKQYAGRVEPPDGPVAVGRMDRDDNERLYIGRQLITDEHYEALVINWQAQAADPYYSATVTDPCGVARKRTFECEANQILNFTDTVFTGDETVDVFLLRELGRSRTGRMGDIVATIQAAQFDIIRQPADQVLVIEGGPGTGKTAIALHRISWLLHRVAAITQDGVLVVGPHAAFLRYISEVLPGLGHDGIELVEVGRLGPSVRRGRAESDEVAALKGGARMAGLLQRAVEGRIGLPESVERVLVSGRLVSVPGADVEPILADSRARNLPYGQRREVFRQQLADLVAARVRGEVPAAAVANLVDRLWPVLSAAGLLRDLFGSRQRLAAAAGGEFTDGELASLYRRGSDRLSEEVWSDGDIALLDELTALLDAGPRRYAHLVVDEAQDLSAMQLRSVARRAAHGLTLLGDLAQSTGPFARDSWDEVTESFGDLGSRSGERSSMPVRVEALRFGYRVPRQAYEFAARLLPVAAPSAVPPEVVREGPAPRVHRVPLGERAGRAVAVAEAHAAEGRFVGIVCPTHCRRELEQALTARAVTWSSAARGELGAAINVVDPSEAKGLEFDAVVVVEPERIVAETARGHRMLYVALTRTTGHLDVVCVGDPLPLSSSSIVETSGTAGAIFGDREVARLVELVAGQIRHAAPPAHWPAVLDQVRQELGLPAPESEAPPTGLFSRVRRGQRSR